MCFRPLRAEDLAFLGLVAFPAKPAWAMAFDANTAPFIARVTTIKRPLCVLTIFENVVGMRGNVAASEAEN